ncbi:hypothetical protein [Hyalangium versicolor]|uniref:hypothetical protein n=1 Tax=Hyalangium versicolor TaxID=2861190 RepID=UPI001CC9870D|nr:hypothetical protein [Hyalangium versicolor]
MRIGPSTPAPAPAASTPPASAGSPTSDKGNFIDKNQPKNQTGKQWGDDIFLDDRKGPKAQSSADRKDNRFVSDTNINSNQVDGNESSRYVEWEQDVAEFQTGTGFTQDGTGAQFEASALEAQGDASYMVNPLTGVKGQAGAEANLASVRGDAGFGKDLGELGLDQVEGKIYGGVHGEALVGANADAKGKIAYDFKNGDVGVEGSAGALVGAEASATARGELGPVQGKVTGGVIAGVGGAIGGKLAFEDGKLTIGAKAKGALGVGLGVEFGTTIDFGKAAKTVENIVGKENVDKAKETVNKATEGVKETVTQATEGVKDVAKDAADTAKDVAKDVGNGVKDAANSVKDFFGGLF